MIRYVLTVVIRQSETVVRGRKYKRQRGFVAHRSTRGLEGIDRLRTLPPVCSIEVFQRRSAGVAGRKVELRGKMELSERIDLKEN